MTGRPGSVLCVPHDSIPADERALAEHASRDGDMAAFEALYRLYVVRIHAFAFRRSGSTTVADDVTSSTFERALRGIASFRWRGRGFGPWLFRIASNELAEHYRAASRTTAPRTLRVGRALHTDPATYGIEDEVLDAADAQVVRECLGRLRPRYQQVITLRYLPGLSADESADAMGIPKSVLAVTLHRALAAMRRELEAHPSRAEDDAT